MTLDRRRFLKITAAGMVVSLSSEACARDSPEHTRELAQPALLEMLGPERVREIGAKYRAAFPNENTSAALRAAISDSRYEFAWLWRQSVERQIRDDFAAGRTVLVNGWVLSETEARQCALYSLSV